MRYFWLFALFFWLSFCAVMNYFDKGAELSDICLGGGIATFVFVLIFMILIGFLNIVLEGLPKGFNKKENRGFFKGLFLGLGLWWVFGKGDEE